MAETQIPFIYFDGQSKWDAKRQGIHATLKIEDSEKIVTMSLPAPKQRGVEAYRHELTRIRDALDDIIANPARIMIGPLGG